MFGILGGCLKMTPVESVRYLMIVSFNVVAVSRVWCRTCPTNARSLWSSGSSSPLHPLKIRQ